MSSTHRRTRSRSVAGLAPAVLATSLVIAALGVLVGATAAQAHNVLRGTDPVDGSTVAVAPDQVTLTFDEPAVALGTQVEVRGPDGTVVSTGEPVLVGSTVSQQLARDRPAGTYVVQWRVTSDDGHPIAGQLTFTASAPTGEAPAPGGETSDQPTSGDAPSSSSSSSSEPSPGDVASPSPGTRAVGGRDVAVGSSAPVIVAVVVVAGLALSWLLWRRRRPRDQP